MLLRVEGLSVEAGDKKILENVSIEADVGELIAVLGPNGSGKTSLAYTIMGHPEYRVLGGRILFMEEDITRLPPYERSMRGLFLVFQHPVAVPGVSLKTLMAAALNRRMGKSDLSSPVPGLTDKLHGLAEALGLSEEHVERELYVGFSGGEMKRAELLQVKLLRPRMVIMDEPDSGLDVDGVRLVADTIMELLATGSSVLLITHYPRLFDYVKPSRVYVLHRGHLAAEGGLDIVERINREGYRWLGDGGGNGH